MKTYEITLKHDAGKVTLRIESSNIDDAIVAVCAYEKAPASAMQSWRVVPTQKQIARTKSLMRGI